MNENTLKARRILQSGGYTCVLCKGDDVSTDTRRGIRPLLERIDSPADWQGYSAADKVVGKAAAFLYHLLGVKSVYAQVISQPAAAVLAHYGIDVTYDTLVSAIVSRDGTGYCPMETAVWDIDDPEQALAAVRQKLIELS